MQLGLGMAAIGRPQYINIKQEQQQEQEQVDLEQFKHRGLQVLNYAYQKGVRYFDTAPGYGLAEELLMEWIADKEDPELEIASKWGYTYTANFNPNASRHEVKQHSLDKLNQQWKQTKRLLPFLSTYQIHSATFESGVLHNAPVLHRLAQLKETQGLRIGITTSGPNQLDVLKQALEIEVEGLPLFDVFQITYNILEQSMAPIITEKVSMDQRFVIKEALANGRLFPNKQYDHYTPLYSTLETLSEKYNTGIDAVALRYCMDTLKPFMILSGASGIKHLQGNLKMNQFELTEEELETLGGYQVTSDYYWRERSALSWS